MSRLLNILRAVGRAAGRGSRSLWRVSGNNMFYAGITLLFMLDPGAMAFFAAILAIVLFVPSSSDPMSAVPLERVALWPLESWERFALRAVSPLLNPVCWVLFAALLWKRMTWGLWAMLAGFFLIGFWGSSRRVRVPWVPPVPLGGMTQLIRKDFRQFLTSLDFYCALLIAAPAGCLRIAGKLPPDSQVPLTALIIIFMSTMALTLFGLELEGGITRYSLLPLPSWKILAGKGAAYLLLMLIVTAPLSPVGGLAGGFLSLAVGQYVSMKHPLAQTPWRFRASHSFGLAVLQMVLSLLALGTVTNLGAWSLGLCAAIYCVSLWVCHANIIPFPHEPQSH